MRGIVVRTLTLDGLDPCASTRLDLSPAPSHPDLDSGPAALQQREPSIKKHGMAYILLNPSHAPSLRHAVTHSPYFRNFLTETRRRSTRHQSLIYTRPRPEVGPAVRPRSSDRCARQSLEGEEDSERIGESETPFCDPPGASPEPVRSGHPPEPSVAWCGSDPACKAYTGCVHAV